MNWFAILAALSTVARYAPGALQYVEQFIDELRQQHPPSADVALLLDEHLAKKQDGQP